jgi:hypothetical protein
LQGQCDAKKIYQIEDSLIISASSKFKCSGNPDPHHFDADPDPAFHSEADPGPTLYSDADPDPTFQLDADPDLDPDPPLLQNYPLRLPPFHFDAYPEPAFHFDADEDPDLDPAFHFNAHADPASQNDADPCGSRSVSTTLPIICLLGAPFPYKVTCPLWAGTVTQSTDTTVKCR